MTIEFIVLPGLVFLAVTLTAKLLELRSDVLYGPYIAGRKSPLAAFCDQFWDVADTFGISRRMGRLSLRLASASCLASAIIG